MWAEESVFYQIYPLGFCDAPFENEGESEAVKKRILKVIDWIPHIKKLGCNAIYFSPIFESDTHGYNTRDYRKIDRRLGSQEDFKMVCSNLHKEGIRVVLDGVFNHVGRGFWAFKDVLEKREQSKYCSWFHINFSGDSAYHDGLWYEGWEGNYDLVKLNLQNNEVVTYLLDCVAGWIEEFDIDGIRLDVAYCLDREFMKRLRSFCDQKKDNFFLLGEMIHGDYRELVRDDMLHSATNYECYKGLYSSFNSLNLFEINHSLLRQFGEDGEAIYKGMHLFSFVDNHDVSRIASTLTEEKHLPLIYAMMMGMPGIPCIYYGSEWGAKGDKKDGDQALRASFVQPEKNELTEWLEKLILIRRNSSVLQYGNFKTLFLTNRQCVIQREYEGKKVLLAINADEEEFRVMLQTECKEAVNLLNGETVSLEGTIMLPAYSAQFFEA